MKSFPVILKDVCYRMDKTQTELAEFLVIDESTLSGWKKRPTTRWYPHVVNLCEAHGWDLNEVFIGKDHRIGDSVGIDGLSSAQQSLLSMIREDRDFAQALMIVAAKLRKEKVVLRPAPVKKLGYICQEPDLAFEETKDDEPPKEKG